MAFKYLALLYTLPLLVLGAKKRSTLENFGLYGYGEGFGGLPLFYADGNLILEHQQLWLTGLRVCVRWRPKSVE